MIDRNDMSTNNAQVEGTCVGRLPVMQVNIVGLNEARSTARGRHSGIAGDQKVT